MHWIQSRARGLQAEFRQILQRVRKTVVLVTHDLDEAIRLGDRIAIMRGGKIIQYDTPDAVLSRPADEFVEHFVGVDRAIKRLSLFTVGDAMTAELPAEDTRVIGTDGNLRDALALMVAGNCNVLAVADESGTVQGSVTRDAIFSL